MVDDPRPSEHSASESTAEPSPAPAPSPLRVRPRADARTSDAVASARPVVQPRAAQTWRSATAPGTTRLLEVPVVRPSAMMTEMEELSPARSKFYAQGEMPVLSMPGRGNRSSEAQAAPKPAGSMPQKGTAQGPSSTQRLAPTPPRAPSAATRRQSPRAARDTTVAAVPQTPTPFNRASREHSEAPGADTKASTPSKMLVESTVSELLHWVKRAQRQSKEDDHDRTF